MDWMSFFMGVFAGTFATVAAMVWLAIKFKDSD